MGQLLAVLLRLLPAALEEDRLAGQFERVDTGEQVIVHSTEQLLAYLRANSEAPLSRVRIRLA